MLPMKCFHQWIRKAGLCLLMATHCLRRDPGAGRELSIRTARFSAALSSIPTIPVTCFLATPMDARSTALGASFERRSFLSSNVTGSWLAEVRPYMTVTDPTMTGFALKFPQQPTLFRDGDRLLRPFRWKAR